jgi:putative ABC transport system permease protein
MHFMLLHYLRVAWRSFLRHTWYSLINVGCLAVGLAVAMTILFYILHEHSYDRWHVDARRIFATYTRPSFGSSSWSTPQLSYQVGPAGRAADPAVESVVRVFRPFDGADLRNPASPGLRFLETSRFIYADSNFFRFFSFRLLRGSPEAVLARPFTVVLTQTAAKKYFGKTDPVGKTLTLDDRYPLEVTGVAADMPSNSSLNFDLVASMATIRGQKKYEVYLKDQQLESGNFNTWFLLRSVSDTGRVARSLSELGQVAAGKFPKNADDPFVESHRFFLTPLVDTHLNDNGSVINQYLSAFAWVAVLILLLALVNYMSLATARSTMRAREVGVRKVIGAGRGRIAGQFYTESTIYALMAFVAGGLLFFAFRASFCHLLQLSIDASFLASPVVIGSFSALLLLVIAIAGSYPSILLSSFRPVMVLYGKLSRQRSGERIRKGFLVFQFTLSMALITCALIVGKELYYIRHADTGVTRENIVLFPFAGTMDHYGSYLAEVSGVHGIRQVATTRYKLYAGSELMDLAQLPGKATPDQLMFMIADSNLIPLLELKWKEKPDPALRWFDRNHLALNEAAVDAFHLSGRATGNHFKFGDKDVTVSGVLKDFNFLPLQSAIGPLGVRITRNVDDEWPTGIDGVLYAKIGSHINIPALIEAVHRIYSRHDARTPFEYSFLDDEFNSQYKAEDRLAALIDIFSTITIVIACLGLFALATFAAQQRLKEIGIRKVLGASVASISSLLSRDFLRPIFLSIVIASPLAWWVMHHWLRNFAYRTPISWWIFPVTGGGLLLIAQLTVLFRTIKAAQVNPTINLRSE